MTVIVFDTEATDLEPGQICQLSSLTIEDGAVTGRNLYFSVDQMSEGAFQVHGLSMDMLAELSGGRYFEDHAQELCRQFNEADLVIGHNVSADERYLRVELERCGLKLKRLNTFCTMNYATGIMNMERKVNTGRPKPPKLEELCAHYGVDAQQIQQHCARWFGGGNNQHDARYDTAATYLCLLAAVDRGDLRGIQGLR
ncbi:MAG: 3'-5' exonuclease [Clostridiales bacterium]|nr:3'-5' exonuclease [Clostridiales bacterium]